MIKKSIYFFFLVFFSINATAYTNSCRSSLEVADEFMKNDKYATEVYVIIDQTTYFDEESKNEIKQKILPFVKPGNRINISAFSEYSKIRSNKNLGSFLIANNITSDEEDDMRRTKLKKLKNCLKRFKKETIFTINEIFLNEFRKKDDNIGKSEILKYLKSLSKNNIRYSKADRKVVIIISDMLENSDYTSFYSKGKAKKLNIDKELKNAKKYRLMSDFDGAEIYVYGIAKIDINSASKDSRNTHIEDSLVDFWNEYLEESKGKPRGLDSRNIGFDLDY